MSDLISRQAAIDAILAVTGNSSVRELYEHVQEHVLSDMWSGGVNAAIDVIIAVPSAQPDMSEYSDKLWKAAYERGKTEGRKKRKKGKWMPLQLSIAYPPYQCSCCFGNAPMVMVETGRLKKGHLEALLTDFCPNCGADMRGDSE